MKDLRLWFAIPHNADELNEAICSLKSMCEELVLSKSAFLIEVSCQKRLPQDKGSDNAL